MSTRPLGLLRLVLLGSALGGGCVSPADSLDDEDIADIGPAVSCKWNYSKQGLGRFKNASTDPGFDPDFNMHVTVSRQGLTARVVGALSDDFLAEYEKSYGKADMMQAITNDFPYVIPITQTTRHTAEQENPFHSNGADFKEGDTLRALKGEVTHTEVIDLPQDETFVMIVYPVSIALRKNQWGQKQYQGVAGNWVFNRAIRSRDTYWIHRRNKDDVRFEDMSHDKENYAKYSFGHFPFLGFAPTGGFGLHGPISRTEDMWYLKRGEASHGCNRMAGEHAVELAVLYGCAKHPGTRDTPTGSRACHDPDLASPLDDQYITVIEEFDLVPEEGITVDTGPLTSWDRVASEFVAVDVDYDRLESSQDTLNTYLRYDELGRPWVELKHTTQHRTTRSNNYRAMAPLKVFPTWDNRFDLLGGEPRVVGESLKFKDYACQ